MVGLPVFGRALQLTVAEPTGNVHVNGSETAGERESVPGDELQREDEVSFEIFKKVKPAGLAMGVVEPSESSRRDKERRI